MVPGDFSWLNDAAVAMHFDALLARLGRAERVLRFGGRGNDTDAFQGHYIIAPPQAFAALCSELGIPLKDFTGSLQA